MCKKGRMKRKREKKRKGGKDGRREKGREGEGKNWWGFLLRVHGGYQ
jgi:hypothetical protein